MKIKFLRVFFILIATSIIASGFAIAQEQERSIESAIQNLSAKDAKEYLGYLASDKLKGREAGTPEGLKAAEYIAGKFKEWGLEKAGDKDSYLQTVSGIGPAKFGKDNYFKVWTAGLDANDPTTEEFKMNVDYSPLGYASKTESSSKVVFAGYGITDKELGYDDYADVDVKDKIVMIYRYAPGYGTKTTPFTGSHYNHAYFNAKYSNARKHKVKAILMVNPPSVKDALMGAGRMGSGSKNGIPFIQITHKLADKILAGTGKTIASLQKAIDKDIKPKSFSIGFRKVMYKISNTRTNGQNVLGKITGSDEKLKDEVVIIGGHYDHIGLGYFGARLGDAARGQIHNGADDNASGTVGVMMLAKAFALYAPKVKRTLIFALWDGEEKGLLGSAYFAANPTVKLKNIKMYINFDMIGRLRDDNLSVINTAAVLTDILNQENTDKLNLKISSRAFGGSDHMSFAKHKIPVLFFITGGHPDYHTPLDTADKINYDGMVKITKFVFRIMHKLTDTTKNPLDEPKKQEKTAKPAKSAF